jgi:hypothetical protein
MAAVQYLATSNYTLASFKAVVRTQSNSLSQQETGLIDLQLNDIIHNAVLLVRSMMGRVLDPWYTVEATLGSTTITAGFGTITIATLSIADVNKITLYDPTLLEIPVVPYVQFNALRALYTSAQIGTTDAIACVEAETGTPNVLSIAFYTGASSPLTTVTIQYPRNPVKVTIDIDTIDLPDHLIPIAQDMATVSIYRKLSKTAPTDVESRVTNFITSQVAQLGLKVSPQNQ